MKNIPKQLITLECDGFQLEMCDGVETQLKPCEQCGESSTYHFYVVNGDEVYGFASYCMVCTCFIWEAAISHVNHAIPIDDITTWIFTIDEVVNDVE